jgi:glycosyltransferase involved in cell wall biosynthesis
MAGRRLRVGFNAWVLANPEVRGLVRYTSELLRVLSDREDVELVLFSPQKLYPPHLDGVRATTVVFPAHRETVWVDWVLPRKLREWEIDIFHAPADRGIPFLKPCPMVVTVHESYERVHWRGLFHGFKEAGWYWKYEFSNYWCADAVITVSETTRRRLIELGVVRRHRCHRTYLAPGREFTSEFQAGDREVLNNHGIRSPYVLYVGGYDERKNVEALVDAFNLARLSRHQLVIVARQVHRFATLRERWKRLRVFSDLILLEGSREQIPALYRGADFLVNPSLWESFSFPMVEAMASGTPILSSNRTALPEIGGDAATYFDPHNIDDFVQALRRYAADEALKRSLRSRGFARSQMFSWQTVAEQTVSIYHGLTESFDPASTANHFQAAPQRQR